MQELLLVLELCDEGSLSDFLVKHLKAQRCDSLLERSWNMLVSGSRKMDIWCEIQQIQPIQACLTVSERVLKAARVGVLVTKNVLC